MMINAFKQSNRIHNQFERERKIIVWSRFEVTINSFRFYSFSFLGAKLLYTIDKYKPISVVFKFQGKDLTDIHCNTLSSLC